MGMETNALTNGHKNKKRRFMLADELACQERGLVGDPNHHRRVRIYLLKCLT